MRLFSDAIKRYVPHGQTFKALPLHFTKADPALIFRAWRQNDVANAITKFL